MHDVYIYVCHLDKLGLASVLILRGVPWSSSANGDC